MKKTHYFFWLIMPDVNFHKLLTTLKILILLLLCGLANPAYSFTAENLKNSSSNPAKFVADLQQQISISGIITDASTGEILPGVNIFVKGMTIGAISGVKGDYSMSVTDRNAILVFSFIGYVTQEVAIAGKTTVNVALAASVTGLDEVIVIGYGTQKRANVVGSVASISGASIQAIPSSDITNSVSGRLPGSIVRQGSGEPGQDAATILIRGRSTLGSSTAPLVVIDGIPGRTLSEVDPSDISSISVLKDASAAIYGASSANGVILVTTKKGQEGRPTLNYQFYQGFMQPTIIPKTTNAGDYSTMISEYHVQNGKTRMYSDADIALYYSGADPWKHPNTNWYNDLIRDWTSAFKHNLTFNGGSKGLTYYLSLGTRGENAIYKQASTKYNQYNMRSKVELQITEWLKASIDFAAFQTVRRYPTKSAADIVGQSTRLTPTTWSFWPNGLPGPDIEYGDNPVVTSTLQTGVSDTKAYKIQNTFNVTITPPFIKGLALNAYFNYDVNNEYQKRFVKPWILYYPNWASATYDSATGFVTNMDPTPTVRGVAAPQLTEYFTRGISRIGNINFTYNNKFGDHNISAFGAFEQYTIDNNNFNAYRTYYITDVVQTINAGADLEKTNAGSASIYARKSYIARVAYNYKEKYLAEFLFRRDGSLKFPPNSRWGNFPGLLLAWRASEENFWKNSIPFVNYFKLRASYGVVGMDPGDLFQYLNKYVLSTGLPITTSKVIATSVVQSGVANPIITWEKQITQNIGFDSKWANDMFHLNAEYFYNKREDILAPRNASVPAYTGIALPNENIARVDNQGFEIEAGYHEKIGNDFSFDLTGNLSFNRNKVVFMDEPVRTVAWQERTGHPYGALLAYNAIGIFVDDTYTVNGVANYPRWTGAKPGDVIFEDVSGDGKITADDMILIDHADVPETFYGITLDMRYKGLTLSILAQGAGKTLVNNTPDERRGEAGNYFQWNFDNRWTPENTNTSIGRAWDRTNFYWSNFVNPSTYWLSNMAYCRLKNAVLSYNIPKRFYSVLGISNASISISGNNLFLIWSAQKYFDPEIANPMAYPAMRTFAIGANVTF
jgi:TonB-linked SusC/RagA family outer membrane protein